MCAFPEVLQVVVVRGRPAALNLCEDATTGAEPEDQVGPRSNCQGNPARQPDLLLEPELGTKQPRHDALTVAALGSMHVDCANLAFPLLEVTAELAGQLVNAP